MANDDMNFIDGLLDSIDEPINDMPFIERLLVFATTEGVSKLIDWDIDDYGKLYPELNFRDVFCEGPDGVEITEEMLWEWKKTKRECDAIDVDCSHCISHILAICRVEKRVPMPYFVNELRIDYSPGIAALFEKCKPKGGKDGRD